MRELLIEKFDKPNVILNGVMIWHNEFGKMHRENGLPSVIFPCGTKHWFKNGNLHREGNKPAVIYSKNKLWLIENPFDTEGDEISVTETMWWYNNGNFCWVFVNKKI
jgi:hypothetical protein